MFRFRLNRGELVALPGPQQPDRVVLRDYRSKQRTPLTARSVGPTTYDGPGLQGFVMRIEDYRDAQARALRDRLVTRARIVREAQGRQWQAVRLR